MEQRIYIVESHGGQYEDRWDCIDGVFSNIDAAIQCAKDICDEYDIDESKLPMTFDEYGMYNYGYPDSPENGYDYTDASLCLYYNTVIDRDGHTAKEFEEMDNAQNMMYEDFSFCTVNSYILDKTGRNTGVQRLTVWKKDGEYEITRN